MSHGFVKDVEEKNHGFDISEIIKKETSLALFLISVRDTDENLF